MKLPVIIFIILLSFSCFAKSNESECPEELKSKLLIVKSDFFDLIKELIDESDYSKDNLKKKYDFLIKKHTNENTKFYFPFLKTFLINDDDESFYVDYAIQLGALEEEYKDVFEKEPEKKQIFVELWENAENIAPHLKLNKFRADFYKIIYFLYKKKVYEKNIVLKREDINDLYCYFNTKVPGFTIYKKKSSFEIVVGF